MPVSPGGGLPEEDNPYARIAAFEDASFGLVPTEIVYAGALAASDDKEAAHWASLIARHLDLPKPPALPKGSRKALKPILDPYTGDGISLRRAAQLYDLGTQLPAVLTSIPLRKRGEINSQLVNQYLKGMEVMGDSDAATALSLAIDMSRRNTDPTRFANNLRVLSAWNDQTNTITDEEGLLVAQWWAENRNTTITPSDALALVDPEIQQAILDKRAEIRALQAPTPDAAQGQQTWTTPAGSPVIASQAELQQLLDLRATRLENPNYLRDAQRILGEIEAPTWIDRAISWTSANILQPLFYAGQRAFIELEGPTRVVVNALIDLPPGGQSVAEGYRESLQIRQEQIQRLNGGVSLGQQYVEDGVLPEPWMGPAFDFLVGWETDPFVLGGKLVSGVRAGRVAPELLSAQTVGRILTPDRLRTWWAERVQSSNFGGSVLRFSRSSESRRLMEAAYTSDEAMIREATRLATNIEARAPLDYEFLNIARRELLAKYPQMNEKAWAEWQNIMRAQFPLPVETGSLAERVVQLRQGRVLDATERVLSQPEQLSLIPAEQVVDDVLREVTSPLVVRLEVPHRVIPVPGFGLGKLTSSLIAESRFGGTRFGKAYRSLFNVNPGHVFRPGVDPQNFLFRKGTRWRVFSEPELRTYQAQATEIIASGVSTESRLVALMEKMDTEAMRRVFTRMGIPEEGITDAISDVTYRFRQANSQQAFGVVEEGATSRLAQRPLLESQLVDQVITPDPILIRKMARRYRGSIQEMARIAAANFGGILPPEALAQISRDAYALLDGTQELLHGVMRTWKFMVVPRPAYIPRVILGDENARFLATIGSVTERVAAQELKFLPKFIRDKVDDAFSETIGVGDNAITIPRAGTYAYEPLANQAFRTEDLLDDLLRRAAAHEEILKGSGSFGRVAASDRQHLIYWQRALNLQLGNSEAGRVALASVANGDEIATTAAKLRTWAKGDGWRTFTSRIGWDDVDEWSDFLARMTHSYTLGRPDIANLAIARKASEDILSAVRQGDRPPIHGPLTESLTAAQGGIRGGLQRSVDAWYRWMVRQPESVLNRQPYYKAWKRRAEVSYYRTLESQGVDITAVSVRNAVDASSTQFALAQVKKIMFDFTENSRFGEMLSGVLPFTQPWAEAYASWGYILLKRNPAMIGYVRNLWDLGQNTGFIRKDPDSGAYSIPWGWVQRATSWLPWVQGDKLPEGLSLLAPLSSFNMFFSSQVDIGGIPVPLPSLAPWAAYPLKAFFSETQNPYLTSYLFNFGPQTPFVSAWMERAARALKPDAFNDQRDIATAMDMLRMYQYLGTDRDENGNLLSNRILKTRALEDARRINAMLATTGFFFPSAGRISFPEGLEGKQAELESLRERLGFEAGTDLFLRRNPTLTLLTVGKTIYDRYLDGIEAPRVPGTDDLERLLSEPGFQRFAKEDSWAAAAIVLSMDEQWDQSSLEAFGQQVHDGRVRYKGLDRFLTEGQAPGFWNAIDALGSWYYPAKDQYAAQGLSSDNEQMQDLDRRRREELFQIAMRFPELAKAQGIRLLQDAEGNTIGEATWEATDTSPPSEIVQARLRELTTFEGFETFPAMLGLKAYFLARDKIADKMARQYIDSITSTTAEESGLTAEWEDAKAAIIAEFPQAEVFINKFLDNDLVGVESVGERRRRTMAQRNPERYARFIAFDTKWENILDKATETAGISDDEQNARYEQARDLVNSLYDSKDQWMMKLWYESKSYSARQAYIGTVINRPTIFYSRFDWELMGLKLSDRASEWLDMVNEAKTEIARMDAEYLRRGEDLTTTPMHEQVDVWVAQHMRQDKSFAKAIDAINTWGWALWQPEAGYVTQQGKAGWAWNTLQRIVVDLNQQIIKLGWNGDDSPFGDPRFKGAYALARDALAQRIAEYAAWSPVFADQVKEIQKTYLRGTPLQDYLMPGTFFALGSVEQEEAA